MSQLFKATETFHSSLSDSPIFRDAVLPGSAAVVKAHPEFFIPVEEAAARDEAAVWETATAAPGEKRATRKPRATKPPETEE